MAQHRTDSGGRVEQRGSTSTQGSHEARFDIRKGRWDAKEGWERVKHSQRNTLRRSHEQRQRGGRTVRQDTSQEGDAQQRRWTRLQRAMARAKDRRKGGDRN